MDKQRLLKTMTKLEMVDRIIELHEKAENSTIETGAAKQEAKKAKDELSIAKSELHIAEMEKSRLQGYIDRVREMETQTQEVQTDTDFSAANRISREWASRWQK